MIFLAKVLLAAIIISFASWLSGKKPELSGFIIALPIASIIAIAFSYLEHKNTENTKFTIRYGSFYDDEN